MYFAFSLKYLTFQTTYCSITKISVIPSTDYSKLHSSTLDCHKTLFHILIPLLSFSQSLTYNKFKVILVPPVSSIYNQSSVIIYIFHSFLFLLFLSSYFYYQKLIITTLWTIIVVCQLTLCCQFLGAYLTSSNLL